MGAAANYKGGFGFQPMFCFADATGEVMAGRLRPGNTGADTMTDHQGVLDEAAAQLPPEIAAGHRPGDDPTLVQRALVFRTDSAVCTDGFVWGCRERNIGFAVVARSNAQIHAAISGIEHDPGRWQPALRQDGEERPGAAVAEVTDLVDLSDWPEYTRLIVRRERFDLGGSSAGGVERVRVPLLDQAEERVALAHLGPGQRVVEEPLGEGADGGALCGGHGDKPVEVPHGVNGLLGREVVGIGRAPARWLGGLGLDEHAPVEHLDQFAVGPDIDPLADQAAGDGVEGFGDLDVVVPVDLGRDVDRQVIALGRRRQQPGYLLQAQLFDRSAGHGTVDAQPGGGAAPLLRPALGLNELLAAEVKEVAPKSLDNGRMTG